MRSPALQTASHIASERQRSIKERNSMTITIPPEALEAAAEDLFHTQYDDSKGSWADAPEWLKVTIRSEARAACLALIENWPGAEWLYVSEPVLALPMPKENSNERE